MTAAKLPQYTEKPWLANYDPDVPHAIDTSKIKSLLDIMNSSFQQYSKNPCYVNFGSQLTFQQMDELSKAFAGFLQSVCKLSKGDRVAIILPNIMQFPVTMFGAIRAGMVVVNINPHYTPRELQEILHDSGAKCVVILVNFIATLEKVINETSVTQVITTEIGDLLGTFKGFFVNIGMKYLKKMVPTYAIPYSHRFKNAILAKHKKKFTNVSLGGEDIAYLQYTGGTTGGLKGAILTHSNMVSNILQAKAWVNPFFQQRIKDCHGGVINALPLYHIFSLTANSWLFLTLGIHNILITNPRHIVGFIRELKRQPFVAMTGVNTLFNALLHNEEFCKLNFSSLIFSLAGGMALQEKVAKEWGKVTGTPLLEAYGLTEACPAVSINPMSTTTYNGSIGLPLPSTLIKICDENGAEVPPGNIGELWIKGPQIMRGYWNQPAQTKEVLNEEGWLYTGDIAKMDMKGFIFLVDRKKDMINVSGFNVFPNEIEDVISKMKEVREVAVIGVKSEEHGEIIKAFIVRKISTLKAEDIIAFCQQELTGYKIPKEIEFMTELPKSQVGKILRRRLREDEGMHEQKGQ